MPVTIYHVHEELNLHKFINVISEPLEKCELDKRNPFCQKKIGYTLFWIYGMCSWNFVEQRILKK